MCSIIYTILTGQWQTNYQSPKDKWARLCIYSTASVINRGIKHRLTNVNHPWTNGQARANESKKQPSNATLLSKQTNSSKSFQLFMTA